MNDQQDAQYAMTTVLVRFVNDNRPAIGASKVALKEADDVLTAYQAVQTATGKTVLRTEETTRAATDHRQALLGMLPVVLGPLRSVATKTGDSGLLARATLGARQLRRLKPEELRDVSKDLLDEADARQAELADYALTAEVLATLRGIYQAFAGTVRGTSSLIDQRSLANQTADDLLADLMQQVYELDKPMEVFRLLNKTLYQGYKKARRIGSTGGGSKGTADKPTGGQ